MQNSKQNYKFRSILVDDLPGCFSNSASMEFIPLKIESPENIAKNIEINYSTSDLVFININYKTDGLARSQNNGILLLKYLRLYNINLHCILYSFLSREQFLSQDTYNLIIFSPGVTYLKLPNDLSKLNFDELVKQTSPDDLSLFLKAESKLPDDRHFVANWWGILQLWNVQKAVERIAGQTLALSIQSSFAGALEEMNSFQGLLARYLRKKPISDIEHHLRNLTDRKAQLRINENCGKSDLQDEINSLSEDESECEIQIQILEETLAGLNAGFINQLLLHLSSFPETIQRKIRGIQARKESIKTNITSDQEFIKLTELIEDEKNRIYESRRKINRLITAKISILEHDKSFSTENFSLKEIQDELRKEKPEIVFVDDQADDGWAAIFQRMIYGGNSESFSVIQPGVEESIDEIADKILEKVAQSKARLVILDLRLKGEKGSNTDPLQVSGVQVLKRLKALKILCPVLITTASNKVWSYKETFGSGSSAFWIKEGLDENTNIETSVDNYLRFIDLVYILCFNQEFAFLYNEFQKKITRLSNDENLVYWWETQFWAKETLVYPKTIVVNKVEIIDCLERAYQLYEDYLKLRIQNLDNATLSKNLASMIVLQCARILEIIHKVDYQKSGVTLSDKMKDQLSPEKYNYWSKLLSIRNEVAHFFTADFDKMKRFISELFDYINTDISDDYVVENERFIPLEPIDGNVYVSKILSKHKEFETYYLENPDLNLVSGRISIVLDKRFNRHLESQNLGIGIKVKFELKIVEHNEKVNYRAINAEIIC